MNKGTDKSKAFGQFLGGLIFTVFAGCMSAVVIALTIKIIQWLIF